MEIIKGRQRKPPRVVVYGQEGIGKSSFGASAPSPLFIQTEDGLGEIECDKFPLVESYGQFIEQLGFVIQGDHEYQTLVVDTLDWLEKKIWANVCSRFHVANIEKADGGYAKGFSHALDEWREVLSGLELVRARGMAVILLAHAKVERFDDPESNAYDRYTLRLNKHADALIREWSDAVLFACRRTRIEKEEGGFNKTRAIAKAVGSDGGERVLRTTGGPACMAKNRYGISGDIPLSWEAFAAHLTK